MNKPLRFLLLAFMLVSPVLFAPSLFAIEKQATLKRETNLFAKPFKDADILATLPGDSGITLLKRKGGWYEARVADKHGWVRLANVRLKRLNPDAEGSSGVGELLSGIATGREKSDEVTTATAVKGLGEEDLKNAEPDLDALKSLDGFTVDAATAELAASEAGLKASQLAYRDAEGNVLKDKAAAPASQPAQQEEDEF